MIRTSLPFYCCLWFIFTILSANVFAQQQQVFKTTPKSVIGYIEYLPEDYHSNSDKYPIVIFLHGLGQRGPSGNDPEVLKDAYADLVFYGPPRQVKNGTKFPFILISPSLKDSYGDWPSWYVMEVIEHVRKYLRVDEKRIYLTGTSLGGGGTWVTAQDYPDYFAAIAPVAGSTNSTSKACAIADSDLPVWAFHGDKDGVVPHSRSLNMVNAINDCGTKVKAKLTTYEGLGHNAYSKAYDPSHNIHNPNLYDWMLRQVNGGGTIETNKPPVVNAGTDQTITLPTNSIALSGNGSDPDGSIAQYTWTKVTGGNATLSGTSTSKLTVSDLVEGSYTFKLTVKDDKNATTSDEVKVTVKAANNIEPKANAGSDKTITLPTNSVELIGAGTDADGQISSYTWTKVSGGNATLSGTTTSTLKATDLTQGVYVFRLTVEDDKKAAKADDVTVTVNGTVKNQVPRPDAGPDKTIKLPINSIELVGTAIDPDGKIVAYNWRKVSGGNATLSGENTTKLKVTNLAEGSYLFRFKATDDDGAYKWNDVVVTVVSGSGKPTEPEQKNQVPRPDAGPDKTITLPVNSIELVGKAIDPDGKIVAYNWRKVSGGNATLSGENTTKLKVTDLEEGSYLFRFKATDDKGAYKWNDVIVTVYAAQKATARAMESTESTALLEEAAPTISSSTAQDALVKNDVTVLKDCIIVVYDASMKRIFTGNWSENSYQQVFNKTGLYIYNVLHMGKRIDSGKIHIQ